MQLLPSEQPAPRLLNTVVPDSCGVTGSAVGPRARSALLKGALLSGNGLAIFVGLILACLVVAGGWWLHDRDARRKHEATTAGSPESGAAKVATPAPVMVQISADQMRVTAISLGQPRLAVINDQQVGEGDYVNLQAPTSRSQIKLRVRKIADGAVELSDGAQTIVRRLSPPDLKPKSS